MARPPVSTSWNVVGVLAGAYRGKDERSSLTHLEVPGTNNAWCGRVKPGHLSNYSEGGPPTCGACRRAWDRAYEAERRRIRKADPAAVLKINRQQAQGLAIRSTKKHTERIMARAARELEAKLATGKGGRFTREQMNDTLKQVRGVMGGVRSGMSESVLSLGRKGAELESRSVVQYLGQAEAQHTGRVLGIKEASMVDVAVKGAEASMLRRIGSDREDKRSGGILDRYSVSTIGSFEEILQQHLIQGSDWIDTRNQLVRESPFLQGAPKSWAERILRTEVMGAMNASGEETIKQAEEEIGGMVKILVATFDDRTAADSYAVHGQIRRPDEPFDTWQGPVMHPPARPNDRETVVPHSMDWPIPVYLEPKSDGEVAERWAFEKRKGAMPPRPLLSTVPLDQFGRE